MKDRIRNRITIGLVAAVLAAVPTTVQADPGSGEISSYVEEAQRSSPSETDLENTF